MASAGIRFSHGRWRATLTADTKDEFYFSDRHGVKSERATLANFSSYIFQHPGKLSCGQGISRSGLSDKRFRSFGNDPRKLYITEPYYQLGEPRIAGVTFQFFMRD